MAKAKAPKANFNRKKLSILSPIETKYSQMNCIVWQTDNYSSATVLLLYPLSSFKLTKMNEHLPTETAELLNRILNTINLHTLEAEIVIFGAHTSRDRFLFPCKSSFAVERVFVCSRHLGRKIDFASKCARDDFIYYNTNFYCDKNNRLK